MEKRKNITSKIKTEIVLFLLRGEDVELQSREHGVTSQWRDLFVENGTTGFKRKPEDSTVSAADRKIRKLQMELELTKTNVLVAKLKT